MRVWQVVVISSVTVIGGKNPEATPAERAFKAQCMCFFELDLLPAGPRHSCFFEADSASQLFPFVLFFEITV